jgi:hypothetical protein
MKKIIFSAIGVLLLFTCISWGNRDPFPKSIINNTQSLSNALDSSNMILRPNGPGSLTQLGHYGDTANWKCVDDVTPDDDASYVDKWGSSAFYDLYTLSDFTGNGIINNITIKIRCDYEGTEGWAYPQIRVDGVTYGGGEMHLEDWWDTYSYTWAKNPKTNLNWTPNDLNALEAGVGLYGQDRSTARCTQVYIVVDYTPVNNFDSILRPNGPGSLTQLGHNGDTPNWKCVDDITADEDATFVDKWGSEMFWDLYALSDFTGSGTINNITVNIRCGYEGTEGWTNPGLWVDGAKYEGTQFHLYGGEHQYATFSHTWTTNPKTNQAWTPSDLNALQAGVGLYGQDRTSARCTQVYVVVDYMSNVPILRVIWPNGGEKLFRGGTYNINWTSSGITGNVDILLLKNTGEVYTIAQNISNSGSYSWTIAQNIPSGPDYKIKISGNSGSVYDLSDSFFTISTFSGPTSLFALPSGNNQIYLGWRLSDYRPDIGYNIYRSLTSGSGYTKINSERITNSTNYIDGTVSNGTQYYYVVRAVETNGFESENSQEVRAIAAAQGTNRYISYAGFVPNPGPGPNDDNYCDVKVGDVDGDGLFDFLVAVSDCYFETPPYDAKPYPDSAIKVMLFRHDGTLLWGPINTHLQWFGEFPWTLHDINGDGKDEIIGLMFDSANDNAPLPDDAPLRLVVMNNEGAILSQTIINIQPPAHHYRPSEVRMYITIAYLDGIHSNIVVLYGTNPSSCLGYVTLAFDQNCNEVWRYTYEDGNSHIGSSHMIRAADVDCDGFDEVISGTTAFNHDGTIKWEKPTSEFGHADFTEPKDILPGPDHLGLELFIGGFENHGCDVEIWDSSGNKIPGLEYRRTDTCSQLGWAANMTDNYPGFECYVLFNSIIEHDPNTGKDYEVLPYCILSSDGMTIIEQGEFNKYDSYSQPIDWDGDNVMEMHDGVMLYSLNPPVPEKKYVFIADVIGDYREEIIIFPGGYNDSPLTGQFYVYTNTTLNTQRKQSPWTNRLYSESKKRTGYRD